MRYVENYSKSKRIKFTFVRRTFARRTVWTASRLTVTARVTAASPRRPGTRRSSSAQNIKVRRKISDNKGEKGTEESPEL